MREVVVELLMTHARLAQLQRHLQEADVGRVRQTRALLSLISGQAHLAIGKAQPIGASLGHPLHDWLHDGMVQRFQQLRIDRVGGRFGTNSTEQLFQALTRVGYALQTREDVFQFILFPELQ